MVTLRDVARAAGVSPATASRALAQPAKVSPARRESVRRAAAELGYRGPRHEDDETRRCLGLIVPDMENPFFASIAKTIQRRARAAGLAVLIADTEEDAQLEADPIAQMGPLVDGFVLCSPRMSTAALESLARTPEIILVNRVSEHLRSVVIDNQDGIRQALRHLDALGHRRIAYAGGQAGSWSDAERRHGLQVAAAELPDVEILPLGQFPPVYAGGVAAADLAVAGGATAVIAHNDLIALGVLNRLRTRAIAVPEQMSVVGFDDIPAATQVSPTLTTVATPLAQVARTAVDMLLEPSLPGATAPGVDDASSALDPAHRSLLLPVSLVVRGSTGPAPNAARRQGVSA